MVKNKETGQSRVVIFVEGDTDEVFFKVLLDYYKSVSICPLLSCEICNLIRCDSLFKQVAGQTEE